MLISSAGLIVDINPKYELLKTRLAPYELCTAARPDIKVELDDAFLTERQSRLPHLSLEECEYIYTGDIFYRELIKHGGLLLHASAVSLDGNAYLFSAPSGTGKSTHTHLWLDHFGDGAQIINDDKPAIRLINGKFYACGTPWSGKTAESKNEAVPVKAIAYIFRSEENHIDKAAPVKALKYILDQTIRPAGRDNMELLLGILDKLLTTVKVYELHCNISEEAVKVAYEIMSDRKELI